MQLLPLADVAGQILPGAPLAWGIRDAGGKLLLARGHRVADAQMLEALLQRGTFVDADEMRVALADRSPAREGFLGVWRLASARLNMLLTQPPADLHAPLRELADVLMSLADRHADKLLYQILRHDRTRLNAYGVAHSLHSAAVCGLSARRLGWSEDDRRTLVTAALSMNLSVTELLGRLAVQGGRLRPGHRELLDGHPQRSVDMLQERGVDDRQWLAAVAQHHERVDGSGYPGGRSDMGLLAQAVHYADVYTAKFSARSDRAPQPPDVAARDLYQRSGGHPLAAALVKEFGIYPPGCFVRLARGELAIVIHRGEAVNTPVVACLTRPNGQPMMKPLRRETSSRDSAIVSLVPDADVMVRLSWEQLYPED